MRRIPGSGAALTLHLAILPLAVLTACSVPPNRTLDRIDVTPASVTAASGSPVEFTATGIAAAAPMAIDPLAVNWSFNGFLTTPVVPGVTIDSTGVATCTTYKGNIVVYTIHPSDPAAPPPAQVVPGTGAGMVIGSATLTCS